MSTITLINIRIYYYFLKRRSDRWESVWLGSIPTYGFKKIFKILRFVQFPVSIEVRHLKAGAVIFFRNISTNLDDWILSTNYYHHSQKVQDTNNDNIDITIIWHLNLIQDKLTSSSGTVRAIIYYYGYYLLLRLVFYACAENIPRSVIVDNKERLISLLTTSRENNRDL